MNRTFSLATGAAALLLACQAPAAPTATAPAAAPEASEASAPAAVHGAEASPGTAGVMATSRPADPDRIPRDAIHAAYRKTGTRGLRGAGGQLPAGHPAVPGAAAPHAPFAPRAPEPAAGETGVDLPLPLVGPGSIDELRRRLRRVPDQAARAALEEAFRLTFTLERASRNPGKAADLLAPLVTDSIAGATASRILGYVAVSRGFDFAGAMTHYGEAVRKDADYGEAHYALAFMHVRGDKAVGLQHFERALSLGVPDTRGIARFYPEASKAAAKQAVDAHR